MLSSPSRRERRGSVGQGKLNVSLPAYIVDAFSEEHFSGNPAAVCLVQGVQDIPDFVKQDIAAEFNLSETAFVTRLRLEGDYKNDSEFGLRWFTPTTEVSLCGHATLAAAAVLFTEIGNSSEEISFQTLSGPLKVRREGAKTYTMDFPVNKPSKLENTEEAMPLIREVLGDDLEPADIQYCPVTKKLVIRLENFCSQAMLEGLPIPDAKKLLSMHDGSKFRGIIVTVLGGESGYDFLSRYFGPWNGIPEDPVTGSAHTVLGPYWSEQLNGKTEFVARQASRRGGNLLLRINKDGTRIEIGGPATISLRGQLEM